MTATASSGLSAEAVSATAKAANTDRMTAEEKAAADLMDARHARMAKPNDLCGDGNARQDPRLDESSWRSFNSWRTKNIYRLYSATKSQRR